MYTRRRFVRDSALAGATGWLWRTRTNHDSVDVERLRFILRTKGLGFTLTEIGELLSLSADHDVRGVKRRAENRLEQVEHKIKELQRDMGNSSAVPSIAALSHEQRQ